MYIKRYLEQTILRANEDFKILYIGGPRQVGKTTILERLAKQRGMNHVSLDDPQKRILAKQDPGFFLEQYKTPLFIDEVQYAPELFPYLKMQVDAENHNGMYWLSGSQHFSMIRGLQESLAGRVGIISLLGISLAEEEEVQNTGQPFFPGQAPRECSVKLSLSELFERMYRGSFPALVSGQTQDRDRFYASYIQTYLDRDVVGLFGIEKVEAFHRVLSLVAAHTGQVLNMSSMASDASLSVSTVRAWLSILESTGLVYFLRPYLNNVSKRMIRAPKMYLLDTGLVAYLTKWSSPETLMAGAMAGSVFETFVVSEILKSYLFHGKEAPMYYYRDKDKREVDVLLVANQMLYPVEIKMGVHVRSDDVAAISYLRKQHKNIGPATVVCATDSPVPLDRDTITLPAWCIV